MKHDARSAFLLLAALICAAFAMALALGSYPLSLAQIWHALLGAEGTPAQVIWALRLPRAATAFVVGAALALAGALMQVLLRNPLADPYVLGLSGGAASGALLSMMAGLGSALVSAGAFGGALLSTLIVFGLGRGEGTWAPTRLLLNGIVVAAGWSALVSFLLAVGPPMELRGMLFWLMGDLAGAGGPPPVAAVTLGVALAISLAMARSLNLLARGELRAQALGVGVIGLRLAVFALSALLTAMAVTLAGSVGFVGLVIPHLLRLWLGSDHRLLLPATVMGGGAFLVIADTLARTVLAPQQLPVGVLSALIGVPLFLYLLRRSRLGEAS